MKKADEAVLVSRAALGDREAFSRLVEACQSPVRRFLFHLTGGDGELSKDLSQETFLKAWMGIASFRAAAGFPTWLYRIACNTFYDHARARKPIRAEVRDTVDDGEENEYFSIDLARALTVLKPQERTAMLLFYMEDRPVAQIAAIMRIPPGTVKSHLSRGREKLAIHFKDEER